MVNSMTGFAALTGATEGWSWAWDIRSVNARGLDIRMRVPDWIEGLDQVLRPMVQSVTARGNISLSLKVQRLDALEAIEIDPAALHGALSMIKNIEMEAINNHDLTLAPTTAAQIMAMRGVVDTPKANPESTEILAALKSDMPGLLQAFNQMRATEGRNLAKVLSEQIDAIDILTSAAKIAAEARMPAMAKNLHSNLARILENAEGADADRVAQELALLAVKADITEEIDRLHAHVVAARELLGGKQPVGRKLDFLTQEFNREANTLCSKSQFPELTRIGLDLKAVIDQMREQVQNVE